MIQIMTYSAMFSLLSTDILSLLVPSRRYGQQNQETWCIFFPFQGPKQSVSQLCNAILSVEEARFTDAMGSKLELIACCCYSPQCECL